MFLKMILKWIFEVVGWLLVMALAFGIVFAVMFLTKSIYIGIMVMATIYFYCSPKIMPYINELREDIFNNVGKKK